MRGILFPQISVGELEQEPEVKEQVALSKESSMEKEEKGVQREHVGKDGKFGVKEERADRAVRDTTARAKDTPTAIAEMILVVTWKSQMTKFMLTENTLVAWRFLRMKFPSSMPV